MPRESMRTKVKNAQEAHEAIRPGGQLGLPHAQRTLASEVGQRRRASSLYELIFQRTVASQMKDAKGKRTIARACKIEETRTSRRPVRHVIEFDGFRSCLRRVQGVGQ